MRPCGCGTTRTMLYLGLLGPERDFLRTRMLNLPCLAMRSWDVTKIEVPRSFSVFRTSQPWPGVIHRRRPRIDTAHRTVGKAKLCRRRRKAAGRSLRSVKGELDTSTERKAKREDLDTHIVCSRRILFRGESSQMDNLRWCGFGRMVSKLCIPFARYFVVVHSDVLARPGLAAESPPHDTSARFSGLRTPRLLTANGSKTSIAWCRVCGQGNSLTVLRAVKMLPLVWTVEIPGGE